MATRSQRVKVGAFLIGNVVVIGVAIAAIAGFRTGEPTIYEIIFNGSVLGLAEGSPVQYQGVRIGSVQDIWVGKDRQAHAHIAVEADDVQVYEGVEAALEIISFATGMMSVALRGGDPEKGLHDPSVPIIAERTLFESFSTQLASMMDELTGLLAEFRSGMENMEPGEIARTVTAARQAIEEISGVVDDTRKLVAASTDTVTGLHDDLEGSLQSVQAGVTDFQELSAATVELAKNANQAVTLFREKIEPVNLNESFEDVRTRFTELAETLTATAATLNAASQSVTYQADTVQYNFVETLQTLNETLLAVQGLAEDLRDNPSLILRGRDNEE